MPKKRKNSYVNFFKKKSNIALAVFLIATFIVYFGINLRFTGPTYLSDEIGYLSKAIFISGQEIDGASSWHAGYSLFISPAFLLFDDPTKIWHAITFINSAMLTITLLIIYKILNQIYPKKKPKEKLFAVFLCAFFPAMAVMAGYSFSSPLTIMTFSLSLLYLAKSKGKINKYLYLFSILVGLLYWVHPSALGVILASVMIMAILGFGRRDWRYLVPILAVLILPAIYALLVDPWLINTMTPAGLKTATHYGETIPDPSRLLEIGYLKRWSVMFMGQLSYSIIATFGLLSIGLFTTFELVRNNLLGFKKYSLNFTKNTDNLLIFYGIISIIFVALIGSAVFANLPGKIVGVHYWFYGRYIDQFIVPILAIFIVTNYRLKHYLLGVGVILLTFVSLAGLVNNSTTKLEIINYVNIQAFWPIAFFNSVEILKWGLIAVFIITLFYVIFGLKKVTIALLVIPVFLLSMNQQLVWHDSRSTQVINKPTASLLRFIYDNYPTGSCVEIESDDVKNVSEKERFALYSYYLSRYKYSRYTDIDQEQKCNSLHMTFIAPSANELHRENLEIIGREVPTGLYLLGDKSAEPLSIKYHNNEDGFVFDNKDYYRLTADFLQAYTEIGKYDDEKLITTNKEGYLLFSPGFPLEEGRYRLRLDLRYFSKGDVARIDIVSSNGSVKYLDKVIKNSVPELEFELRQDVEDLEVRIKVDDKSSFSFSSYELFKIK